MAGLKQVTEIATIDVVLVTVTPEDSSQEYALDTASKLKVEVQTETDKAVKVVVKGMLKAQKPEVVTITGNKITMTDNVFSPELVKLMQGGTITMAKNYTYTATGALSADDYSIPVFGGYLNFTLATPLATTDTLTYSDETEVLTSHISSVAAVVGGATIGATATGTVLTVTSTETDVVKGYTPPVAGSSDKGKKFFLNAYSAQYDASGSIIRYERISYPNCYGDPISFESEDGVFRAPEYIINSAPKTGEAPYAMSYHPSLPTVS